MASNGTLQVVEDVEGTDSEEEAPASTNGVDVSSTGSADEDLPPPLLSDDGEEEDHVNYSSVDTLPQNGAADASDDSSSAGFSSDDDDSPPSLAGDSDSGQSGSDDDEESVPDLDDPDVSALNVTRSFWQPWCAGHVVDARQVPLSSNSRALDVSQV